MNSEAIKEDGSQLPSSLHELGSRISALADALGTRKNAASVMGVSVDSLARYIRGENMPPFDVLVRLTRSAGKSLEWLATGQEPDSVTASAPTSQPLRPSDVSLAVQLAEEALEGRKLEPPDYGELVALIHDALVDGLPSAKVLAFAKPAARGLSGGANARSTVGGARQDAPGKGKGAT